MSTNTSHNGIRIFSEKKSNYNQFSKRPNTHDTSAKEFQVLLTNNFKDNGNNKKNNKNRDLAVSQSLIEPTILSMNTENGNYLLSNLLNEPDSKPSIHTFDDLLNAYPFSADQLKYYETDIRTKAAIEETDFELAALAILREKLSEKIREFYGETASTEVANQIENVETLLRMLGQKSVTNFDAVHFITDDLTPYDKEQLDLSGLTSLLSQFELDSSMKTDLIAKQLVRTNALNAYDSKREAVLNSKALGKIDIEKIREALGFLLEKKYITWSEFKTLLEKPSLDLRQNVWNFKTLDGNKPLTFDDVKEIIDERKMNAIKSMLGEELLIGKLIGAFNPHILNGPELLKSNVFFKYQQLVTKMDNTDLSQYEERQRINSELEKLYVQVGEKIIENTPYISTHFGMKSLKEKGLIAFAGKPPEYIVSLLSDIDVNPLATPEGFLSYTKYAGPFVKGRIRQLSPSNLNMSLSLMGIYGVRFELQILGTMTSKEVDTMVWPSGPNKIDGIFKHYSELTVDPNLKGELFFFQAVREFNKILGLLGETAEEITYMENVIGAKTIAKQLKKADKKLQHPNHDSELMILLDDVVKFKIDAATFVETIARFPQYQHLIPEESADPLHTQVKILQTIAVEYFRENMAPDVQEALIQQKDRTHKDAIKFFRDLELLIFYVQNPNYTLDVQDFDNTYNFLYRQLVAPSLENLPDNINPEIRASIDNEAKSYMTDYLNKLKAVNMDIDSVLVYKFFQKFDTAYPILQLDRDRFDIIGNLIDSPQTPSHIAKLYYRTKNQAKTAGDALEHLSTIHDVLLNLGLLENDNVYGGGQQAKDIMSTLTKISNDVSEFERWLKALEIATGQSKSLRQSLHFDKVESFSRSNVNETLQELKRIVGDTK